MKVKKIEDEKNKLKVEVEGEDHSLVNLLVDESFETGATTAFAHQRHPMIATPTVTVGGDNPKKILENAAKNVEKRAKEFQKEFK